MTTIVCATCTNPGGSRNGRPWCDPCGIWLVLHEPSGQWVSYAEREYRQRAAETEQAIAASIRLVDEHLARVHELLPEGWSARTHQAMRGALYAIAIDAPDGVIDATSYLQPPTGRFERTVTVHNRVTGVGFPSFADGGARAASFHTVDAAIEDAVGLLRGEIHDLEARRRWRDHPRLR
ncbi:hypothetical protein [Plantactinospora sp. CA-290183]|uniref:hypothetical protein n=1 Tax=Plantactinospora sp. CA-290183 TaxID=3240006 RepID=UPI003D8D7EB1